MKKNKIANECIAKLSAIIDTESPDQSRIHYLLGQLNYNHPNRNNDITGYKEKIITFFKKPHELNLHSQISKLYLGHCYQDIEKWHPAIEWYEQVDTIELATENPYWKWSVFKLWQLLSFCHAKTGHIDKAESTTIHLLDSIESAPKEEVFDFLYNLDEAKKAVAMIKEESIQIRLEQMLKKHGLT